MLGSRGRLKCVVGGLGAVVLALAATSATAAAAPKPISGKLNAAGYTVLSLDASGEANSDEADRGKFRIRPPAKEVTLHLRAADGTYGGPIVVGKERKGRRAIVGVRAGAKLGKVEVKAGKGYAKPTDAPPEASLDRDQQARARNGVPVGAGVFGRVRSRGSSGQRPDSDLDGLPNPLDVDDNGNLVLDNLDTSGVGGRALRTPSDPCGPGRIYCQEISSSIGLSFEQTVNANLGSSDDQINAALATFGSSMIRIGAYAVLGPGDSAELDCGDPDTGLAYCRKNGSTGTSPVGGGDPRPFPGCCDGGLPGDPDGFGTLSPGGGGPDDFFLAHGAHARVPGLEPDPNPSIPKIGTGDPIGQWVTKGGAPSQCPPLSDTCVLIPTMVQYVIATVPTLKSYSDGAGHSATVAYPTPTTGPPPRVAPGSEGNGFPVSDSTAADDPDTDVELTLTFWRPQRRPVVDPDPMKGEKCPTPTEPDRLCTPDDWIDIGGLTYGAAVGDVGGCPQSSYPSANPPLSPPPIPPVLGFSGGFTDGAPDRPADPENTFTYELNLSQCLAAHGASFGVGEEQMLNLSGQHGGDTGVQKVAFKRE